MGFPYFRTFIRRLMLLDESEIIAEIMRLLIDFGSLYVAQLVISMRAALFLWSVSIP